MSSHFQDARWREVLEFSALGLSSYCLARGRYELAHELHAIGTESYERAILNKELPDKANDDGKRPSQFLEEYKQRLAEFPLLVATRSRLLESVIGRAEGIDRDKLKTAVKHEGSTAFGVICNQLARGGWIRQEKTGKKYTIYPESTVPISDELFISKEMPIPDENNPPVEDIYDPGASHETPEGYELIGSDPIIRKPMTAELQQILDDARHAGYFVQDDHANDGLILIRPYFESELADDDVLGLIPKPCGVPRVWKEAEEELPRGLTIWPDHTARRMDVKPWLAEDITDYAVMRSVLGLQSRPTTQPEPQKN
jgi:hypothetical protein